MQRFLDLFISINCSTCFRRFLRPSSGPQNCTYSVRYCQTNTAAAAIVDEMELHGVPSPLASSHRTCVTYNCCCMYSLRLIIMDGETETCRVLFQNKINLRYCASVWFYCRNIVRCTVLQGPNMYFIVLSGDLLSLSSVPKTLRP
jgi:hypothetical protein